MSGANCKQTKCPETVVQGFTSAAAWTLDKPVIFCRNRQKKTETQFSLGHFCSPHFTKLNVWSYTNRRSKEDVNLRRGQGVHGNPGGPTEILHSDKENLFTELLLIVHYEKLACRVKLLLEDKMKACWDLKSSWQWKSEILLNNYTK